MLQGHNEQECWILHSELNQVNEDNDKHGNSSHSNDRTKGKVSNINRVYGGGRNDQDHKWSPIRRRFPNKGYQDKKASTSKKTAMIINFMH